MKKTVCLMLAVMLLTGLMTACGGSKPAEGSTAGGSAPEGTPSEIIDAIYAEKTVDLNLMTIDIALDDADAVRYNLGLEDASKLEAAAVSEPMMGSQAYSLAVVRVKDAADAAATAQAMADGIDQRKWICVEADTLRVMTKGPVVVLFMVDSRLADTVTIDDIEKAFTTVCGGSPDKVVTN